MEFKSSVKNTLSVSRDVIRLVWKMSPWYTVYIVILLTGTALIPILEAFIIKKIIDSISLHITFSLVVTYIVLFVLVTLLNRIVDNQRNLSQIILGNLFQKEINQAIVEKTTKLDFWRFEDPTFHDKLDRVREQATWKPLNTFFSIFGVVQDTFGLISVLVVLSAIHIAFVPAMILFSLPSLWVQISYGGRWWNLIHHETPKSRKLAYYQHLMTSSYETKDIKLLNLRTILLSKYAKLYDSLFYEQKKLLTKRHIWQFFTSLISDVVFVLFYFYVAWQAFLQRITIGDFTFYTSVYSRGVMSMFNLVRDMSGVYENNLFIKELFEFLETPEEKETGDMPVKKLKEGFEFKDVWFKYPGTENWILKGVNFQLPLKSKVALVGENGAGKTTIVKLLTRMYLPTKGQILLEGKPIEQYDINSYRQLFGVAFQDFAKFFFTAEDNIKIGDISRKIPQTEVQSIAKKMQIHNKIMTLPKKYQTILGRWWHEGHELSYGEWQRLAIARALIRNSPIYILDEPTAALDAKAEYIVFKEFKQYAANKTALFISHRFSNVKLADLIIVLENGQIIERGTHQQLLQKTAKYHQLYHFQAKRYQEK